MRKCQRSNWLAHLISAIRYTFDGFKACYTAEVAFRQEILLGVVHLIALMALPLSGWTRLYMISAWLLLLAVELVNSAIEAVVDLVSPNHNELAKKAKDCGSAAVFCVVAIIVGSWLVLLTGLMRRFLV